MPQNGATDLHTFLMMLGKIYKMFVFDFSKLQAMYTSFLQEPLTQLSLEFSHGWKQLSTKLTVTFI
jgi:hypothetical protein